MKKQIKFSRFVWFSDFGFSDLNKFKLGKNPTSYLSIGSLRVNHVLEFSDFAFMQSTNNEMGETYIERGK